MMIRRRRFSKKTQEVALIRQNHRCGSCGVKITKLGRAGAPQHKFGEVAHAHHIVHAKYGGRGTVENCVILCSSCHYSAHEGGDYRFGSVQGTPKDFPYFEGLA